MKLDEAQQEVVNHGSGHALVLAGAGSGKTACCVARAVKRIRSGVDPRHILMLTFTNKAAREMRERIAEALGEQAVLPIVSTFHAWGHRFIRSHPEACGRDPSPSLMDEGDADKLLCECLDQHAQEAVDGCAVPGNHAQCLAQAVRTQGLIRSAGLVAYNNEDHPAIGQFLDKFGFNAGVLQQRQIIQALIAYESEKEARNLLDFDDLIILPTQALRQDAFLRDRLRRWLHDITVDESQDNNGAQYQLLLQLASKTVVMVGDDDQGIYKFRGAAPENLARFRHDFRPQEYRLERNYRSLPQIVNSATTLVRVNRNRLEKNPFPAREATHDPIALRQHRNGDDMAQAIAADLAARIRAGESPDRLGVLYRVNALGKALEGALTAAAIPYYIKAGVALMERREARLLTSVVRFTVNPRDEMALVRLADLIPGVGPARIAQYAEASRAQRLGSILEAAPTEGKIGHTLGSLARSLERLRALGPSQLSAWAVGPGGLREWMTRRARAALKQEKIGEAHPEYKSELDRKLRGATQIIKTLQNAINQRIQGVGDIEEQWEIAMDLLCAPPDDETAPKVTLSTVHGAKGLQWNTVHLAGFSDGLMPLRRGEDGIEDPEEERRLAYVGLTRAEDQLILHHARRLYLNGQDMQMSLSPYLAEAGLGQLARAGQGQGRAPRSGAPATAGNTGRTWNTPRVMRL